MTNEEAANWHERHFVSAFTADGREAHRLATRALRNHDALVAILETEARLSPKSDDGQPCLCAMPVKREWPDDQHSVRCRAFRTALANARKVP